MADSNATYGTSITVDMPDFPGAVVSWKNSAYFTSGNNEIFPGQSYDLTLDANGQGTQVLPCPDNTGDTAINWYISLPSKQTPERAIAYSATPQALSDILAAGSTTTNPDDIIAALANKANKVNGGTTDNIVTLTADGDIQDGGTALSTVTDHIANTVNPHMVQASQTGALAIANNLTDLSSAVTARTNLDVYGTGDFSAAPTAAEPLKGDGSGGLTLLNLTVSGSNNFGPTVSASSSTGIVYYDQRNTTQAWRFQVQGNSGHYWSVKDQTNNTVPLRIDVNQPTNSLVLRLNRMGVNELSPDGQLHVKAGTAATIGQIIELAASATANAIEVQNSAAAVQFAIGPAGQIKTNQAAANTNTPSGATAYQLPWYAANGTLLGYVPVYPAAW